jgi:hypothetical protein
MLRNEVQGCFFKAWIENIALRYEIRLKLGKRLKDIFQGEVLT